MTSPSRKPAVNTARTKYATKKLSPQTLRQNTNQIKRENPD